MVKWNNNKKSYCSIYATIFLKIIKLFVNDNYTWVNIPTINEIVSIQNQSGMIKQE